ncbi:uncharacterized protein LOC110943254 [Helianthus annuus]|uniref:uncharacterized protein LOC110943254 n=1 Tax=Helianthus annuus TaxID=4232 RepID=UPI000B8F3F04|nr:uncharacterized protein LOC110943254 [Helianthus annuus]
MVISQSDQVIHTQIHFKADRKVILCSFVYAENSYQARRVLWEDLSKHNSLARDKPWLILGDFNVALSLDDCSSGSSSLSIGMRDFYECVKQLEVLDIPCHGMHFTWNQKPREGIGVLKKLDRIMGNIHLLSLFPEGFAFFHPPRISDHTPCVFKSSSGFRPKPRPFKFPNFITSKPEFMQAVVKEWSNNVTGHTMFSVVKKMKNLKPVFRKILHKQGILHERVSSLRKQLDHLFFG